MEIAAATNEHVGTDYNLLEWYQLAKRKCAFEQLLMLGSSWMAIEMIDRDVAIEQCKNKKEEDAMNNLHFENEAMIKL
uniref:Uncharacterized protein n=1 Tax=Pristionchus pacificus TaxID=54126 RepID=A0A2A6D3C8_PRIPA|eukprot:PDM84791.1 hypothetical protein PRIPAC_33814 [Pristionchus pacificus]